MGRRHDSGSLSVVSTGPSSIFSRQFAGTRVLKMFWPRVHNYFNHPGLPVTHRDLARALPVKTTRVAGVPNPGETCTAPVQHPPHTFGLMV